ncbi:MAG: hypothetical protein JWN81_2095 [Solirubrobacterales bacterium]|nr:hypothetical protein [Solirubrobacterales bacterium]
MANQTTITANQELVREFIRRVFNEHRFAVEGTNEGSLFGFPATGKTVRWDEIDTYRVANGKIAEEWSSPDMANILHQVAAYTPPWIS